MCDYSLEALRNRPAKVGDKLITRNWGFGTTGFCEANGDPNVAVCLSPGTELAFDKPAFKVSILGSRMQVSDKTTATFRHIALDREGNKIPHLNHDALEFADNESVLLTALIPGQIATVLQLPVSGDPENAPVVEEVPAQAPTEMPAQETGPAQEAPVKTREVEAVS